MKLLLFILYFERHHLKYYFEIVGYFIIVKAN